MEDKIKKIILIIVLIFLINGCATQQAEPYLHAQKAVAIPPSFTEIWGDGKSTKDGNHEVVRTTTNTTYNILSKNNGKDDGASWQYDKETKKIRVEISYKNGFRDGWMKRYSPEGGWLYKAVLYRNGKKLEVREYNTKGEMVHSTPYLDDEKNGIEQRFSFVTGDLTYRVTYKQGTPKRLVRYCKGKPQVLMQMNGCRHGVEKEWYCGTDTLARETLYKSGKRNGVEKHYDKAGRLLYSATFRNGFKDGAAKEYYLNGAVKYSVTYHKDKVDEVGYYYPVNGKKERIDYDTLITFSKHFHEAYEEWWRAL